MNKSSFIEMELKDHYALFCYFPSLARPVSKQSGRLRLLGKYLKESLSFPFDTVSLNTLYLSIRIRCLKDRIFNFTKWKGGYFGKYCIKVNLISWVSKSRNANTVAEDI